MHRVKPENDKNAWIKLWVIPKINDKFNIKLLFFKKNFNIKLDITLCEVMLTLKVPN